MSLPSTSSNLIHLEIILPNKETVQISVRPKTEIRHIRDSICKDWDLPPINYALTYRMTLLKLDAHICDFLFLDGTTLKLVEDFRPNGQQTNVTLKVEGMLCSAYFRQDVTLWTIVQNLVAEETLNTPGHHPLVIFVDEEYIGEKALQEIKLCDVSSSHQVMFRFKNLSKKTERPNRGRRSETSNRSATTTSASGPSTSITHMDSTSSLTTVGERLVCFKRNKDLVEIINITESPERCSAEIKRTTFPLARKYCCTIN